MKNLIFILFLTSTFFAQKKNYLSINGNITGFSSGSTAIISDRYNYYDLDSTTIINDKFNFRKFNIEDATYLFIKIRENNKWYFLPRFFDGNSNVEIIADKNNLSKAEIKGSYLNNQYNDFSKLTVNLENQRDSIYNEISELKKHGNWDTIIRKKYRGKDGILDCIDEKILDKQKSYFLKNANSIFTQKHLIARFISELKTSELTAFYNTLTPQNKNNKYGKYIKSYLATNELKIGDKFPELTGEDLEGKKYNISTLIQNKISLIAFETPFCQYCTASIPEIKKLLEKYNFNNISYYIDTDESSRKDYNKENNVNWLCLWDKNMKFNINIIPFRIEGTPKFFLISKDGTILNIIDGYDEDVFYKEVEKFLINEPR